ncbi:hypothetical protein PITC_079650 [Penicillium italicum]|uniref:Myb-like domain-containing protein n=1 Tax=Penicillium italicum TaxID=40296 RepID=A0A0A2KI30_PENIT|nr:hypothetical protein PITC_079650 [Penicillium italicum]
MPTTKKKAGGRKRDNAADLAELERLRKQVAEQSKALEAEEARKEEESQAKRQVSSRRQRTLVRWDVDTDIRLLLAIQYGCNKQSVKIPWKEVADAMGEKFTEGAIVQHLSKIRAKREEQDKPNPPPLKRAGNGHHKTDTSNKKDASAKADPAPSTSNGKRRRRDPSDDDSEDSVYTLKKKQFAKNKKKDKVFVAPKLRTKREETASDDSQKLVCVGAEWLRDFTTGDDREDDDESASSEENESSTESSQATTQATKSKMVKLKLNQVDFANWERRLSESANSREPVTPTNPTRATNMAPHRPAYYPYLHAESTAPYSPMAPAPFVNNFGGSIPYPSNGPSPFDIVNRVPNGISDAGPAAAPSTVSGEVSAFGEMGLAAAYSQFDMPPGMQFEDQYGAQGTFPMTGYTETSGFENQFISDSELFANLPNVEPPRYFGYEGEDTKEF